MSALAASNIGAEVHGQRRLGRRSVPTLSALVAVGIHAVALVLCTVVVYQTAFLPMPAASEVVVSFDTPGFGLTAPTPVANAASGRTSGAPPRGEVVLVGDVGVNADGPAPMESPLAPILGLANAQMLGAIMSLRPGVAGGATSGLEGTLTGASGAFARLGLDDAPAGVTFAGLGASTARSVVYCVDCSGPMVTSLPMVLGEVRRSVARLAPTQKFGVVLFRSREGRAEVMTFSPSLLRATVSAQERLDNWLASADPSGKSCPLIGLEAALSFKPDAVFLLSRSIERSGGGVWELGLQATLSRLEALNPALPGGKRAALIQTIQFVDDDPTGVMQAIALAHGGGSKGYRLIKQGEEIAP